MQKNWMEEQYEEWKQFHEDRRTRVKMQPILQTAWDEAEEKGIDPDMKKLPKVSSIIKQQMKESAKQMFVHTQSISTMIIQRAEKNKEDYCLLLFDVEKVLIKIYGNDKMLSWLSERGIEAWTDWSEEKSDRMYVQSDLKVKKYAECEVLNVISVIFWAWNGCLLQLSAVKKR